MPRRRQRKRGGPQPQGKEASSPEVGSNSSYLIKTSDALGRYLVASQDLPAGCVVISDDAIVVGPAQDSQLVCLGCYSPILDVAKAYRCCKCQWPMCSSECKGLYRRLGHSREECCQLETCSVVSTRLAQEHLYNAIVPLRILLLKEHQPDNWHVVMSMEAHNDIRRRLPSIWEYNQKSVVDRIMKDWQITSFSEEEIHTVCGILEVNAFAVGDDSLNIRGLYPTSFLIAHDCVPNTSHTDDEEYHIKIFTSIAISKGGIITLSYTNSLQGTRKRRQELRQCKFFDCVCARCKDPTELGTNLSTLRCEQCDSGHLLAVDSLAQDTAWVCGNDKCDGTLSAAEVDSMLNRINVEIQAIDNNNIEEMETCIRCHSKVLHKNHYLLLGMKYTLSQLYGKSVGFLIHEMTEAMLERKVQICEDVLQIFDVLEPGLSQIRGLTMYELHAPIMVLTIKRFEMRKISKGDLCRRLRRVALLLRECIQILKFETQTSQEGIIRTAAEDALNQLKSWEPVVGKF